MNKIISIANEKGGVGKSTCAMTAAAYLAKKGCKVLLLDLDAQRNTTRSLRMTETAGTTYDLLANGAAVIPSPICENLDGVAADSNLTYFVKERPNRADILRLRNWLSTYSAKYDFTIIDTPPAFGLILANALTASDYVIIPMRPQFMPLQGIADLTEAIEENRRVMNPALKIAAVYMTEYDNRTTLHRDIRNEVEATLGDLVCKTTISRCSAIAEAPITGQSIFDYAPESKGAKQYAELMEEILKRI